MKKERKPIPPEGIRNSFQELGVPRTLLLGLQHMFAMFGATILVPILIMGYFQDGTGEPLTAGVTVSTTLFCAGVGTLLFHICTKLKVPAFLGSSFAYLGGFMSVANLNTGAYAAMGANEKCAYACGGVVIAGLLYLVLALIIKVVGVKRVMRYLPPVVTGPIIICIGLSLAGSAIGNASTNWLIALVALAVVVVFNIWGKGMFKIIPILMGVVIAYIVALFLNAVRKTNADGSAILDFTSIASASWVGLP
ncbi:MAG: uracil-xanthine permease, partial [Oscillospiraceae bacterium]|nr:uracil-xanthine permease [Oscillospiraceae bacterium]